MRVDPHTDLPGLSLDDQVAAVELVKQHVPFPVKASGNVSVETISALDKKAARFDLDIEGFKKLIASLDEKEARFLNMPVTGGTDEDPLAKLDGVRKAQAQRLVRGGGLKVQKRSRLRG